MKATAKTSIVCYRNDTVGSIFLAFSKQIDFIPDTLEECIAKFSKSNGAVEYVPQDKSVQATLFDKKNGELFYLDSSFVKRTDRRCYDRIKIYESDVAKEIASGNIKAISRMLETGVLEQFRAKRSFNIVDYAISINEYGIAEILIFKGFVPDIMHLKISFNKLSDLAQCIIDYGNKGIIKKLFRTAVELNDKELFNKILESGVVNNEVLAYRGSSKIHGNYGKTTFSLLNA